MLKRFISVTLVSVLCVSMFSFTHSFAKEKTEDTLVSAKSAVLVDANSGAVLYALNENKKLPMASVTKIMSLLLVMEAVDSGKITYQDKVSVSKNAQSMGGSQIWAEEGETFTVDELLKATAIASANDACTALGEYVAGSSDEFVKRMNERALQLGMKNTHFDNCTGLDDTTDKQYSSAYDIALMSRALLKYEHILEYTTTWMDSLRSGETELVNTNRLIRSYSGITGLKTGTTSKAGFCVSATATRENTSLIAVVMGSETSEDRFASAASLLDYGFANYESVTPKIDTSKISSVDVNFGTKTSIVPVFESQPCILVEKGSSDKIDMKVKVNKNMEAPIHKGDPLGEIIFTADGKEVGRTKLISRSEVERLNFLSVLKELFKRA